MSIQQDPCGEFVRATVAKVEERYVVAYPLRDCGDLTDRDSVTFSLPYWQGTNEPERGQVIELIETALYSRGWRAKGARPVNATRQLKQKVRSA